MGLIFGRRRNPEHVLAVKSTVDEQDVAMGVELDQATKSQQILMTTFATSDTGKAIVQDAAIEASVKGASYIGPEKAILALKAPYPPMPLQGLSALWILFL